MDLKRWQRKRGMRAISSRADRQGKAKRQKKQGMDGRMDRWTYRWTDEVGDKAWTGWTSGQEGHQKAYGPSTQDGPGRD